MARAQHGAFFWLVVIAGFLAAPNLALAQGELFDTSEQPHAAGAKLMFAGPASTMYVSGESVERAATATAAALAAAGWQQYSDPFSTCAKSSTMQIMTFKKGPHAISAYVTAAPAQGNQTSMSYTAVALANDLPFPKDAGDIQFAPDRPHLRCTTGEAIAPTMDFFRKEFDALGYQAWIGRPATLSDKEAVAFFTRDNQKVLVVTLTRGDAGPTNVSISAASAKALAPDGRSQATQAESPERAAARAAAREQHERMGAAIDAQINAQIGQVLGAVQQSVRTPQPPAGSSRSAAAGGTAPLRARADSRTPIPLPDTAEATVFDSARGSLEYESSSDVRALADFYNGSLKADGWSTRQPTINRDNMVVLDFTKGGSKLNFTIMQFGSKVRVRVSGSGLVTAAAQPAGTGSGSSSTAKPKEPRVQFSEQDLQTEEVAGYPVPRRRTSSGSESTQFRVSLTVTVPMDVETMLAFYRRELSKLGWTEEAKGKAITGARTQLAFASPEGPASLRLERKGRETLITLALRKPEVAKAAGVLPKPGQAKVLLGNPTDEDAVVTINKRTYKVAAGAGAKNPDGPSLDLPPGKYRVSLKQGRKPAETETIEIGADETWGLLIAPGGLLPLHVY